MEFEPPSEPYIHPFTTVIHSHIDPMEIGRMYGVDVGLVGDERLVIADLLGALPDGHRAVTSQPFLDNARSEWTDMFVDSSDHRGALSVNVVAEIVANTVNETTTVVLDATTSTPQLLRQLPHDYPEQIVTSSSGGLGWGMGASLGFALGMPGRRVLAICGDGAFQFGIQALWTASHYSIPVTFLVINNQSYAAVGAALRRYGQRAVAKSYFPCKDLSGVDIAITARSFGIRSHRVTTAAELVEALRDCQTSRGPALVEIMTDPQDLGLAAHPGAV